MWYFVGKSYVETKSRNTLDFETAQSKWSLFGICLFIRLWYRKYTILYNLKTYKYWIVSTAGNRKLWNMLVMIIFSNNIMIWNYNNYFEIRYLISADRIKWNDREEKMWGAKLLKPYSSSCRIKIYATTNIIII